MSGSDLLEKEGGLLWLWGFPFTLSGIPLTLVVVACCHRSLLQAKAFHLHFLRTSNPSVTQLTRPKAAFLEQLQRLPLHVAFITPPSSGTPPSFLAPL